jgi:hypothetical protein
VARKGWAGSGVRARRASVANPAIHAGPENLKASVFARPHGASGSLSLWETSTGRHVTSAGDPSGPAWTDPVGPRRAAPIESVA